MKISQIKKQSRKIIKGSVKSSSKFLVLFVIGILLFSALPYLVDILLGENNIITISVLLLILVFGIFCLSSYKTGSKAWFIFYNKKKRGTKSAFWFNPAKAVGCTGMYVSLFFRKLMWALAFLSPGALIISSAVIIALNGGVEFNLFATWIAGGTILFFVGVCFLYSFLQRYFLVPYLKAKNPSMKSREIIKKSKELMADNIIKTALLKISFMPWVLISLTLIPSFYAWAYYSQSCAVMALELCGITKKEKNTDSDIEQSEPVSEV